MKNAEAEREKELKAAQQKLNAAKAKADAFNKKLKQKQQVHFISLFSLSQTESANSSEKLIKCVLCPCLQESDAVTLELEELQREQTGYEQQIQAVDEAMTAIQEQIDSMACTVAENKVCICFIS